MSSNHLERSLPNSSESERAVLGGVVLDNSLIAQSIELLKPDDFYVPSHRRIFLAMIALFETGKEINPILIGEELKKENALELVGGISFITNLTYGLPRSSSLEHYTKVLKGQSLLRNLVKTMASGTAACMEQEDDPEVIFSNIESAIFALHSEHLRGRFTQFKPVAEAVLERIQELGGRAAVTTGLPTGFTDIDRLTAGLQKQDLIILAARPSMGKTSLALMLAEHAAVQHNAVVGIFSLEMSKEALVMRVLCAHANVDFTRMRNGFLTSAEWRAIAGALGSLGETRLFMDDSPGITVLEMRAKAMRLAAEQKQIDLIIVDYLQLMSGSQKRIESRQQEVSQISRELKGLAKELDVPLVALSQLSRATETRTNHRPQLADLRESGALEQDADVVAFIYREEQYKTQEERDSMPDDKKNIAEIIIAKQRNGPTDTVSLRFTPSSMRFDNLYKQSEPLDFS